MRLRITFAALLTAAWSAASSAHHSPAAFDMSAELLLEGTVVDFSWRNPHSLIKLETAAPDGTKSVAEIEAAGISILQPLGFKSDSIRTGEHITVVARPNRRGPGYTVLGMSITKSDGLVLPLRLSGRSEPRSETSPVATTLAGRWVGREEDFFALRANILQRWPLTAAARTALAGSDGGRVTSRADCIPFGPPTVLIEPVLTTIEITADTVVLTTDSDGNALRRVVHLDRAEHPRDLQATFEGHSIGRWADDVLIVDSVGFEAHPHGFGFGVPSSGRKHLVERFSLSEDGRQLVYEATIEDPEILIGAMSLAARLDYRPDLTPSGSPCDLEAARHYLNED